MVFITLELHAFYSTATALVSFLKKVPSFEFISSHNALTIMIASNATIYLCENLAGDKD